MTLRSAIVFNSVRRFLKSSCVSQCPLSSMWSADPATAHSVTNHGVMMLTVVRGILTKLFVVGLLSACVGVHVLEASGRWDRSLTDANDEAGIIAIVLCVGVAISFAGTVLKATRLVRLDSRLALMPTNTGVQPTSFVPLASSTPASPPLPLRV